VLRRVVGGNLCKRQVRSSDIAQYLGLDGIEAGRGQAALRGDVGGVAVRPETKSDQIQEVPCDRVVGEGIELRPKPVRRLHLAQEQRGQLAAGVDGTRNPFS
jgi:hypothetical protein